MKSSGPDTVTDSDSESASGWPAAQAKNMPGGAVTYSEREAVADSNPRHRKAGPTAPASCYGCSSSTPGPARLRVGRNPILESKPGASS